MDIKQLLDSQFISFGKDKLERDKFKKIDNDDYRKPSGGLWGQIYVGNPLEQSWYKYCVQEELVEQSYLDKYVLFKLKENSRVFIINNSDDLSELVNIIGKQDIVKHKEVFLNFENACNYFDAIFITKEGERLTNLTNSYCYNNDHYLWGWDVETLLLLNFDCIEDIN